MRELIEKVTMSEIIETAGKRDPRSTVRQVCTLIRNIESPRDLGDTPVKVSLYIRNASYILIEIERKNGKKIGYSEAVCIVVKKLLEYEVFDAFLLQYYPSLIEVVICGRLPVEIISLIEGLSIIPLLLPEEYRLFSIIINYGTDFVGERKEERMSERTKISIIKNITKTLIKALGELLVYGSYEVFLSVRNLFIYKRLVRMNREDPEIKKRINDPKELIEPDQSVIKASQVRDKSYSWTMQIPPLKN